MEVTNRMFNPKDTTIKEQNNSNPVYLKECKPFLYSTIVYNFKGEVIGYTWSKNDKNITIKIEDIEEYINQVKNDSNITIDDFLKEYPLINIQISDFRHNIIDNFDIDSSINPSFKIVNCEKYKNNFYNCKMTFIGNDSEIEFLSCIIYVR